MKFLMFVYLRVNLALWVSRLTVDDHIFSIHSPSVSRYIAEGLALKHDYSANLISGLSGVGLVEVWVLSPSPISTISSKSSNQYVMKWRPHFDKIDNIDDQAEIDGLLEVAKRHTELALDPTVVFPSIAWRVFDRRGDLRGELIVARLAPGKSLSSHIHGVFWSDGVEFFDVELAKRLVMLTRALSVEIRNFHCRYKQQHGDLHAHNIFIDERGSVSFIDLQTMARPHTYDIPYLKHNLKSLESQYLFAPQFWSAMQSALL